MQSNQMKHIEQWFVDRKLSYKPKHFITSRTPITVESLSWIVHSLVGRYHLNIEMEDFEATTIVSFEDHSEAMLYELTWS
jgi:hypothetical protein